MTRNEFGHVRICWWVTLFLRVSYWDQVAEMNFSSINFDKLLKTFSFLTAESYIVTRVVPWKSCSWKFRNIHRKTPVMESLFNKVADLQSCNVAKKRFQHTCFPVNIGKSFRTPILKIICKRLLLPLEEFCKDFFDISYENASFGILEYSYDCSLSIS